MTTNYSVPEAQIDQLEAQVAALRASPITAPPDPGIPPEPPSGGGNVETVAEAFPWADVGKVVSVHAAQGVTYAFAYEVPAGYAGSVWHQVLQITGSGSDFQIRMWESSSAGGAVIAGTLYSGLWINGVMEGGRFTPPNAGKYFFNVCLQNKSSPVGAQQRHSP